MVFTIKLTTAADIVEADRRMAAGPALALVDESSVGCVDTADANGRCDEVAPSRALCCHFQYFVRVIRHTHDDCAASGRASGAACRGKRFVAG